MCFTCRKKVLPRCVVRPWSVVGCFFLCFSSGFGNVGFNFPCPSHSSMCTNKVLTDVTWGGETGHHVKCLPKKYTCVCMCQPRSPTITTVLYRFIFISVGLIVKEAYFRVVPFDFNHSLTSLLFDYNSSLFTFDVI